MKRQSAIVVVLMVIASIAVASDSLWGVVVFAFNGIDDKGILAIAVPPMLSFVALLFAYKSLKIASALLGFLTIASCAAFAHMMLSECAKHPCMTNDAFAIASASVLVLPVELLLLAFGCVFVARFLKNSKEESQLPTEGI